MNALDLISAAYIGYTVVRGWKRGLADESFRLLRLGLAVGAGCGLYGLVSGAIEQVLALAPEVSGPVGFAGTVGGAWMLLRALKRKLIEWIAARFAAFQATGGAVAGGLRGLVATLGVLATGTLAGGGGLLSGSWLARFAGILVK